MELTDRRLVIPLALTLLVAPVRDVVAENLQDDPCRLPDGTSISISELAKRADLCRQKTNTKNMSKERPSRSHSIPLPLPQKPHPPASTRVDQIQPKERPKERDESGSNQNLPNVTNTSDQETLAEQFERARSERFCSSPAAKNIPDCQPIFAAKKEELEQAKEEATAELIADIVTALKMIGIIAVGTLGVATAATPVWWPAYRRRKNKNWIAEITLAENKLKEKGVRNISQAEETLLKRLGTLPAQIRKAGFLKARKKMRILRNKIRAFEAEDTPLEGE